MSGMPRDPYEPPLEPADSAAVASPRLASPPSSHDPAFGAAVLRKVTWRLIPFLFLLYIVNLIDRSNVGMTEVARPSGGSNMLGDLGMNAAAYGWGKGLFYLGYILFEVPSNLILARTGARKWIARILITWGLVTSSILSRRGPSAFARCACCWGSPKQGSFRASSILSTIGFRRGPRAGDRFVHDRRRGGRHHRQPPGRLDHGCLARRPGDGRLAMGFSAGRHPGVRPGVRDPVLSDRPARGGPLADARGGAWLVAEVAADQSQDAAHRSRDWHAALVNPRVWLLIGVYFTVAFGDNAWAFAHPRS